ncbi:hypothetical protein BZM27_29715 [Paraburkholderia steynii]|uniref:Uncharacterized protein n=1 Tax=Paraburkholderia steynii TaxID=1245441 RepID=A0A4R0XG53_9BURK|nr:hypothetical protein BZM27_29715 [Paraburkholderia steynii]
MNVLQPFIRVVLIVLTAFSGSANTAAEHTFNETIALDPARSWAKAKAPSRRSSIGGASRFSVLDYPKMIDMSGSTTDIFLDVLGSTPPRVDLHASMQHTAFGVGSYALSALGYSAPAD